MCVNLCEARAHTHTHPTERYTAIGCRCKRAIYAFKAPFCHNQKCHTRVYYNIFCFADHFHYVVLNLAHSQAQPYAFCPIRDSCHPAFRTLCPHLSFRPCPPTLLRFLRRAELKFHGFCVCTVRKAAQKVEIVDNYAIDLIYPRVLRLTGTGSMASPQPCFAWRML